MNVPLNQKERGREGIFFIFPCGEICNIPGQRELFNQHFQSGERKGGRKTEENDKETGREESKKPRYIQERQRVECNSKTNFPMIPPPCCS